MVRAHIQASRALPCDAAAYLGAAREYLRPRPGLVVATGGLQGTGKSTLARAQAPEIGAAPGALVLRSDEIRKRLHGAAPEERLPEAAYAAAANDAVNRMLAEAVQVVAAGGHAVIADATFLDRGQRAAIADAARAAGVPFLGLWLQSPLAVLEARVAARRSDASDATIEVLRRAAASDPGPIDWVTLDARDAGAALGAARGAIADLGQGR